MKKVLLIAVVLLLLFATTCYIFYVPPRQTSSLGVTCWAFGPQTNAGGQMVYMVGITNGGSFLVYASAGTETRNGQFASYNMSGPDLLKPGEETGILVTLPVTAASPQPRITASFQRVCSPHWRARAQWYIDTYLFKRAVFERSYPSELEIIPPQPWK